MTSFFNDKIGGDIITFKYRYRKQIILGILLLIMIIVPVTIILLNSNNNEKDKKDDLVIEKKTTTKKEKVEKEMYKVDIKGEVLTPGIYSLDSNKRVIDVIEMSGGLTENADTSVINLSKKIKDEMVIIIYSKSEVKEFEKTKEIESQIQEKCIQKDENSLKNDACISTDSKTNGKISINTGTKEELMTLSGIGESKAQDIIKYREENGPFKTIEDIKNVSGIGDSLFAKIKENITT